MCSYEDSKVLGLAVKGRNHIVGVARRLPQQLHVDEQVVAPRHEHQSPDQEVQQGVGCLPLEHHRRPYREEHQCTGRQENRLSCALTKKTVL